MQIGIFEKDADDTWGGGEHFEKTEMGTGTNRGYRFGREKVKLIKLLRGESPP